MTIKGWSAAALIGCWLAAGCYGAKPEMKEGQSHWLTACSSDTACGDGELCACGVCTIACGEEAECGAEAVCADVDVRAACDDAPSAISGVCLGSCVQDDDCGSTALECEQAACVAVTDAESPDAAVPDAGDGDSSAPDEPLACIEIQNSWVATLDALVADEDNTACESYVDCTCADTGSGCRSGCAVEVNAAGKA